MTGRIKRLVMHLHSAAGRKPKLVPMSKEDERIAAEIHRRRQERLNKRKEVQ